MSSIILVLNNFTRAPPFLKYSIRPLSKDDTHGSFSAVSEGIDSEAKYPPQIEFFLNFSLPSLKVRNWLTNYI